MGEFLLTKLTDSQPNIDILKVFLKFILKKNEKDKENLSPEEARPSYIGNLKQSSSLYWGSATINQFVGPCFACLKMLMWFTKAVHVTCTFAAKSD